MLGLLIAFSVFWLIIFGVLIFETFRFFFRIFCPKKPKDNLKPPKESFDVRISDSLDSEGSGA